MTRLRWAWVPAALAALLLHARSYDLTCDDAFIALRYARNLSDHGQLVYNLGERVEGFSSPPWVLLEAALLAAGVPSSRAPQVLGALAAALLVLWVSRLAREIAPERPHAEAAALGLVASTASVAAWTLGGLETPLVAALVVGAILAAARLLAEPGPGRAAVLGAALAALVLTRHDGGLLAPVLLAALAPRCPPRLLALAGATALLPVGVSLAARWGYYGQWLPHTFHAKSAADLEVRLRHGAAYLRFVAGDIGLGSVVVMAGAAYLRRGTLLGRVALGYLAAQSAYVAVIGGDFLDLHRFLVPTLAPLLLCVAIEADALRERVRWSWALGGLLTLYGVNQALLRQRALQEAEGGRAAAGVEPLGWTRKYARLWGETGRWLRGHATAGDSVATGAAGAIALESGLPCFDLHGLTSPEVTLRGVALGARPGHHRYATVEQILARNPSFLLIDDGLASPSEPPPAARGWRQRGYRWATGRLEGGAPLGLWIREDRAAQLAVQGAISLTEHP